MPKATTSVASAYLQGSSAARSQLTQSHLYETSTEGRKSVTVDGEQYWIVEGDTLLDRDQLAIYALTREQAEMSRRMSDAAGLGIATLAESPNPMLIGMTENGRIVRWAPNLTLTYRLARSTFTSQSRYEVVREAMNRATQDWENTCGIRFGYRPELDDLPGTDSAGTIFVVREIDARGEFIASAFFPNDPINRRRVLIDPSYFGDNLGFDRVGVLRHELGHVLGFRHEHIRSGAPPVCPREPLADTVELSQYDPQSVMHYFCGLVGSRELRITAIDRAGSQQVYGPPLNSLQLIEA